MGSQSRLWGLSIKALIVGTIVALVALVVTAVVVGFFVLILGLERVEDLPELAIIIIMAFIPLVSIFIGALIAGRLAPNAGSSNGTAVAVLFLIIITIIGLALVGVEILLAILEDWYLIFIWVPFGGLGGGIGARWAKSRERTEQE
jgi:putative membrane protein (TIGR04086 family)